MEGIGLHHHAPADHARRHGRHAQGHHPAVLADGEDAGRRRGRACTRGRSTIRPGTAAPPTCPSSSGSARARSTRWTSRPARGAQRSTCPGPATTRPPPLQTGRCTAKSLRKMREYGFTTLQRHPRRSPITDSRTAGRCSISRVADVADELAKELGFLAVVSYGGGVAGIDAYYQDMARMKAAGFNDYAAFIKAVYGEIQRARGAKAGPGLLQPGRRADRRRLAARPRTPRPTGGRSPRGRPYFTAASSFSGNDRQRSPFPALARPCTWSIGTSTTRRPSSCSTRRAATGPSTTAATAGPSATYMYKAAKQFGMKFRLSWHWNAAAGDPYYALDCREDDYAWCNSSPEAG